MFPSTPEPPPPKPPPPKPPAFLDEPWRQIEGWDKSTRKEMRSKIVDLKPEQFDVQTFNIILTGQIGAGKSCFYNSINSALSGCIRPFTAASGKTGQSFTKEFNMYPFRHNPNIRIGDIMGMDVNGSDVDIRNILKVVDGHVLNGYQFHSGEEFKSTDNPKYIPCPSLAERPHCVGLVINAHDFSNILGAQERNLHRLSKAIIDRVQQRPPTYSAQGNSRNLASPIKRSTLNLKMVATLEYSTWLSYVVVSWSITLATRIKFGTKRLD
ncbi:interferon-induced protein 44-like isoform X2 [Exaiptasia diaphana]|uniref:Interferon-induced protein 44-like n=1 Tax=Exaiptasia diaphana TaxID=2652724 RepID=A0A913Y286_EXADI|nr:interferon-induced protein 44-like isoform X2 [Exaiptasia diaphana]